MDRNDGEMDIDPPEIQGLSLQEEEGAASDFSSESIPSGDDSTVRYEENDRVYTNSEYFLPDDELEETRQSIVHQAFTLFLDRKLVMASINPNASLKMLDIGTGGGDWALAAATKYTRSTIIATDISAGIGSATAGSIPANLQFQVDDARDLPWTFESDSFDVIHLRGLGGAFTEPQLLSILGEARRCLKPNTGILEIGDFGAVALSGWTAQSSGSTPGPSGQLPAVTDTLPTEAQSYLAIYNAAMSSASDLRGSIGANDVRHVTNQFIETAGFRIQRSVRTAVPLGEWSRDRRDHGVGRMANVAMLEGLEAKSLRLLTRDLGWMRADVAELCDRVKAELLTPGARPTVQCHYIVARRIE